MLILPKSKTLVKDVECFFVAAKFGFKETYTQVRLGRYVSNVWNNFLVAECLLLDDDDNVIDGFVRFTVPHLPWKNKSFATWLGGKPEEEFDIEQAQDDYDREYWSI